jgi:hypothetical protein
MAIAALALTSAFAFAVEPVKHIGVYVTPFYEASKTPGGTPKVGVGTQFNDLLASNKREDILAARDLIVAKPATRASAMKPIANIAGIRRECR